MAVTRLAGFIIRGILLLLMLAGAAVAAAACQTIVGCLAIVRCLQAGLSGRDVLPRPLCGSE